MVKKPEFAMTDARKNNGLKKVKRCAILPKCGHEVDGCYGDREADQRFMGLALAQARRLFTIGSIRAVVVRMARLSPVPIIGGK